MTFPDSSPKGSLEELFRHHLLESEAAAVAPRLHVWEQLDNSLLIKENEQYRRRLLAYRWAMAASLLLAVLAGGGWWHSQLGRAPALAAAVPAARSTALGSSGLAASQPAASTTLSSSLSTSSAIDQTATLSLFSSPVASVFDAGTARQLWRLTVPAASHSARRSHRSQAPALAVLSGTAAAGAYLPTTGLGYSAVPTDAALTGSELATTEAAGTAAADQLSTRLASLRLPASTALPALSATTAPLLPLPGPKPTRAWQLQVAYAASVFDPNVDFTKAAASYDPSLGPGTVATTRDAAAEYRHHLRPGLGQRLSVWATRRLGIGRWSLRTGVELAQNSANSASSVSFVGQQVSTLNNFVQVQSNRLQGTSYQYYSAGVPVEMVYTNPMRRGFSLYGRVGALFTGLLSVRSEVAGDAEAGRVYSWQSADSPYRRLLTNVRGGVGMRYQPSNRPWAVSLGPVAEAGILSLNLDPTQTFWNQQRPYSFGLEAGVEFSSLLKPAPVVVP